MQIPVLINCAPKFPHILCTACDFSRTPRTRPASSHTRPYTYDRSYSRPNRPCHALIPVFNSLTSDRSRGGSRGDFNTKSLPLSLPACVTAYQRPLSDVGNPGPCPPNPCRPGRLSCPNQTENYRTGPARVDFNETPISLCPLCGQEERSLEINLSPVFTHMLSSSFHFSPRKLYFWALHPIKLNYTKAEASCCSCSWSWRKYPLKHGHCGIATERN